MSTIQRSAPRRSRKQNLPPLENGDHLDQQTFHARYEAMGEDVRAELIGGIVYMASPQKRPHSWHEIKVHHWLSEYAEFTPGTEALGNPTDKLGPQSEPQPDGCLLILPEFGGQCWLDKDEYLNGAPELIAEIGSAAESIDLNSKKQDYEKAGVREYVMVALRMKKVFWFVRRRGKYKELVPGTDGILRSEVFPGLWLDAAALLHRDSKRLLAVVRQGLASPEHAAFAAKLAAAR